MSDTTHDISGDISGEQGGGPEDQDAQGDVFTEPAADRPPTADEEAAAERAAGGVDVDAVAAHAQEAARLGANVEGEGEIEPTPPV